MLKLNLEIDILRIGDPDTPKFGTLDPEVLRYLGFSQRLLITDNRTSMPKYLEKYWQTNQQIWGMFWVCPNITMGKLAEELILIWEISEAEKWINIVDWIPF